MESEPCSRLSFVVVSNCACDCSRRVGEHDQPGLALVEQQDRIALGGDLLQQLQSLGRFDLRKTDRVAGQRTEGGVDERIGIDRARVDVHQMGILEIFKNDAGRVIDDAARTVAVRIDALQRDPQPVVVQVRIIVSRRLFERQGRDVAAKRSRPASVVQVRREIVGFDLFRAGANGGKRRDLPENYEILSAASRSVADRAVTLDSLNGLEGSALTA